MATKTKKRPVSQLNLWIRMGDASEYENHGQDDCALADHIFEHRINADDIRWLNCPRNPQKYAEKNKLCYLPRAGFIVTNSNLQDNNYVSCYWGDDEGNLVQPLTKAEQKSLVARLKRLEADNDPDDYDNLT